MNKVKDIPVLIKISILAIISGSVYITASSMIAGIGFPLDDAWIHQTYSRNLYTLGEWSYIPGYPSAGSTSPLWTLILALGYFIKLQPFIWTFLVGWTFLVLIGYFAYTVFSVIQPNQRSSALWVSILMIFEWHLVWAAVSGMETIFFSLIVLVVVTIFFREHPPFGWLGFLLGMSVWVRPDGITLVAPVLLVLWFDKKNYRTQIGNLIYLCLGFMLPFLVYLLFNRTIAGNWWPNTFYAKQIEYAIELREPLWKRIVEQVRNPLMGVGIILMPGFVLKGIEAFRKHNWALVAACLWVAGFLLLYALRLPVAYQHGRYVMPVLPVYLTIGAAGMANWVDQNNANFIRRIFNRSWKVAGVVTLGIYWLMGAGAYSQDVAFIQSEMVATARWVAENTAADDLIAAHDIGALGYFGNRKLIDLAGLISPQVIPFIRDEDKLAIFIDDEQGDYLVSFPGWYPNLIKRGVVVYTSGGKISPRLGGENMSVYRWLTEP